MNVALLDSCASNTDDEPVGYAKNQQLLQEEQGWSFTDSSVCTDCVDEPALKAAVLEDSVRGQSCTFCASNCSAPLDTLMAAFVTGIRRIYYRAIDELGWDGREGAWQGASTMDSWDLVGEFDYCFPGIGLCDAIRTSIEQTDWVAKDYARPSADAALMEGWEKFCNQIKYETRYVIWRRAEENADPHGSEIPPASMLDAIGQLVDFFPESLVRELSPDTALWRARPHNPSESVSSSKGLGTTPTHKSRTNRMSPAGIAMFYAALDPETAVLEATQGCSDGSVSVGAFYASRPLTVVDLTHLREPPSIFAADGDDRPQWLFLHQFTKSLRAKPELPELDYVPTQVVTEYFLKVFGEGEYFDGLLYASDVEGGGRCMVLNVTNERCVESLLEQAGDDEAVRLALDVASVATRPVLEKAP
jgi:hypothetical protein